MVEHQRSLMHPRVQSYRRRQGSPGDTAGSGEERHGDERRDDPEATELSPVLAVGEGEERERCVPEHLRE